MAVDYTKVFTVIGSYVDKINDYYTYIATYTSDQASIEAILSAQSLVRLEGDLVDVYSDYKLGITNDIQSLISRVTTVLTDDTLIGQNFSFGQSPSLSTVWPTLIKDMAATDKNVKANTATVGFATYTTYNTNTGVILVGTTLDAVTPPIVGGIPIPSYYGITTQLTPTSESLTLTCIRDSLPDGAIGSEVFQITGTGAGTGGYDPAGENIGISGTISPVDSVASNFITNNGFENWTGTVLDNWTIEDGVSGTDYTYSSTALQSYSNTKSIKTIQVGGDFSISQSIPTSKLTLGKSYFFGIWAAKDTDTLTDQTLRLDVVVGGVTTSVTVNPSSTAWTLYYGQFLVPSNLIGASINIRLLSPGTLSNTNDAVLLDNMFISPCEYFNGFAMGVMCGPNRFVVGDTITIAISNSDAGKFQTAFRKMYGIQLPTDATPTISDSLVT